MRIAITVLAFGALGGGAPASAQMQPRDLGAVEAPVAPPVRLQQPIPAVPSAPAAPTPGPRVQPAAPPPAPVVPSPPPPVWQTVETQTYGQWSYTAQRNAADGNASCAIHTHWHETGRQLRIVALADPDAIFVRLSDPRWTMPVESRARGTVQIDSRSFTAEFTAIERPALSFRLASGSDAVTRFLVAFRAGNQMRVTLPGDAFVAGLRGSSAAMEAMTRCTRVHFGGRGPAPAPSGPIGTKG